MKNHPFPYSSHIVNPSYFVLSRTANYKFSNGTTGLPAEPFNAILLLMLQLRYIRMLTALGV